MTPDLVISVVKVAMITGGTVMAPILATGLLVGMLVGALQGATSINEPTMTFVPKVVAVGAVCAYVLPWGLDRFVQLVELVVGRAALLGAS